jgi:hypothetical protein
MSAAIVLAIVVATQNVDDQATEAMRATAAEAIGGEDSVLVREVDVPSDREALKTERGVHAMAVAQLTWLDDGHTHARLRVHVAETDRWTERPIAFSAVDSPTERGRALGFAVTSMLPEEVVAANPYRLAAARAAQMAEEQGTSLRLAAIGSPGTGGKLGAVIALEFLASSSMSLRLGFGGRVGDIEQVFGQDTTAYGAVGIAFWPVRPSSAHPFAVGVRADGLIVYHYVSHRVDRDTTVHLNTWLPGVDVLGEMGWNIVGSLEIIASVGIEAALSSVKLKLGVEGGPTPAEPVATIPPVRGVGELGIRVSF